MRKVQYPTQILPAEGEWRPDRAYVVISGRRIWLGTYGSPESYKRYAEVIRPKKTSLASEDSPPQPAPTVPTINVLMADYLRFAIDKYGERGPEVVHLRSICRMLRRLCGALPAKDFGPKRFKQLRAIMICEGWSRTYVRDQCGRVKRMVGWAVSEEILPPYARHALDAVVGLAEGEAGVRETGAVEAVPDDVLAATLPCVGPVVRDMIELQRLTGMRPGELVQLRNPHIDRSGNVWLFTPARHKNKKRGKQRTIAIGPRAQAILSKYLFAERCFGYSSASYRRAIHRACDRAGIDRWSPNRLRHSAATTIRKEFGLEAAQIALGHSRADVTQIYAERDLKKGIEVALRIG